MDIGIWRSRSNIRLLHASPGAPAVDVYANDNKIASNLAFKNLTRYIDVRPGRYNIKVYPAGRRRNPVLVDNITVRPDTIYTVAVINRLNNLALFPVIDLVQISPAVNRENTAYIRASHLSPNAPAVNVRIDNRTIANNLNYKSISRYVPVDPGTYNINIFRAGTDNNVLRKVNVVIQPGFYYTIYVLGLVNEEPPLQAIVPIDGIYYLSRR